MKKNLFFILVVVLFTALSSCGNKTNPFEEEQYLGDDFFKTKTTTTVKITATENVLIDNIIIIESTGTSLNSKTIDNINTNKWEKDITHKGIIAINVSGNLKDDKPGKLTLQLIRKGKVVEESTSEGSFIFATATK